MSTYLLDVNVLLAINDPMHIHHEAAYHWSAATGRVAWASCPRTENGFVGKENLQLIQQEEGRVEDFILD